MPVLGGVPITSQQLGARLVSQGLAVLHGFLRRASPALQLRTTSAGSDGLVTVTASRQGAASGLRCARSRAGLARWQLQGKPSHVPHLMGGSQESAPL